MRLNQAVARRAAAQTQVKDEWDAARVVYTQPRLLAGVVRTYEPHDDQGDRLPEEVVTVQQDASQIHDRLLEGLVAFWDHEATVDWANCTARADVVLADGTVVLQSVPTTYLLYLEHQLDALRKWVLGLPTLDPSQEWSKDPASGAWKSKPVQTVRTQRVPKVIVKYEATDKHPAQTELFPEDKPVGIWTRQESSTAFPPAQIREWSKRIRTLAAAVHSAREEANSITIDQQEVGRQLANFLFS